MTKSSQVAEGEKPWALAGAVLCFVLFAMYMRYQAMVGANEEEVTTVDEVRSVRLERRCSVTQTYIGKGDISLRGVMQKEIMGMLDEEGSSVSEVTSLKRSNSKIVKKLEVRVIPRRRLLRLFMVCGCWNLFLMR